MSSARERIDLLLPCADLLFDPVATQLYALEEDLFKQEQLLDNERDRLEELMEGSIERLLERWRSEAVDACAGAVATFAIEYPHVLHGQGCARLLIEPGSLARERGRA